MDITSLVEIAEAEGGETIDTTIEPPLDEKVSKDKKLPQKKHNPKLEFAFKDQVAVKMRGLPWSVTKEEV